MSTTKRSEYERTSRQRAEMKAAAALLGWSVLDVLGAYLTPENEVVVITKDGQRFGATVVAPEKFVPERPDDEVSAKRTEKAKKIYAPKSFAPEKWNAIVKAFQDRTFSKEDALKATNTDALDEKQQRQATAVIEAMPDVPDWYAHLPLAD